MSCSDETSSAEKDVSCHGGYSCRAIRNYLKKLFNERRKKHLGAVKNIKNVESYEQRYKMISLIIDEMVRIIESKKVIIERFNDELKKNSTTSLSDGTIKDALLSVCENTVLFGEIVLENPDITERILKKKSSSYEILKWSLTFVHENPLLLDQSTIKMLHLVFQELNLVTRMPNYSNPNWTTNMKKLSSKNINDNKECHNTHRASSKRLFFPLLLRVLDDVEWVESGQPIGRIGLSQVCQRLYSERDGGKTTLDPVSGQKAKNDDKKEEFTCPEGQGNGNFADPATCRRFYQCVDGYPYLNRCPSGLHFDDISKFCTFRNEARCGPIPTTPAPITERPTDLAERCDTSECNLPYCFCSRDGTIIPGGLDPEETPQMILLTFDGAVNHNNFDHYQKIFNSDRVNPNNCPLKGTFFISHEYCNYNMVQSLAHDGHEIATETISLQKGLEDKGYEEWVGEMIGMREILNRFANITRSEVTGMRGPYLKPGRNTQYKVIEDFGYVYDSSIGISPSKIPIWPYTLDYKIPHECKAGTCPTKSFPGVWELPLNAHYVESYEGGHCPYLDQCVLHNHDPEDVFQWLQEDFNRYYLQNRAPYMMPFHTNWFQIKELERGLSKFLDWLVTLPDVYFVTATQALTWMTDPKPLKALNNYDGWSCGKKENIPGPPCNIPNKCALDFKPAEANFTTTRYLETCSECPNRYPWLGDAKGSGQYNDNYNPETK
ncbi:hypothetical protein PV326_007319 [Microctonus aethiopoides]|nr:hypothetical protein PV326_007319 [Microctonus aethiopoides]